MAEDFSGVIDKILTGLALKHPNSPIIQAKGFAIIPVARRQTVQSWLWKDGWDGKAWLAKLGFRGRRTNRDYLNANEQELSIARLNDGHAIEVGSDQAQIVGERDEWVERWDPEAQKNSRILMHQRPVKRVQKKKFYVVLMRSKKFLVLQEYRTAEEAIRGRSKATYRYLDKALRNLCSAHGLPLAS